MFCPKCGAQQPNGLSSCPNCGYCFSQQNQSSCPQEQPVIQTALQAEPMPLPANFNTPKITKFQKNAGKLVYITFFLTLVLLVASVLSPLTTDLFELSAVDIVSDIAFPEENTTEYAEEYKEETNKMIEEIKSEYNKLSDEIPFELKQEFEQLLESVEKLSNNFSLLNFRNTAEIAEEVVDDLNERTEFNLNEYENELDEAGEILDYIILGVIGLFALPFLFTLLGGLLKSKVLTILALIFTVIPQLLLCGIPLIVCTIIVYIVQVVFCAKAKKYKKAQKLGLA